MLAFEGISVLLILMLAFLALAKTGVADTAPVASFGGACLKDYRAGRGGGDFQSCGLRVRDGIRRRSQDSAEDDSARGNARACC